ncbi:MAG TPA: exopolysaccharide biosynthesis protein, partial [Pseudoxanthomonas sp.]|nr:exopolysaccharide biosynthesis protein [Pseudoxanthomonas sp.]
MTTPPPDPGASTRENGRRRGPSTQAVLDGFAHGDPDDHLRLGDLVSGLRQTAFGMLLFVGVLPAFIPIPGLAGAISGPLVMLIGMQLLIGL